MKVLVNALPLVNIQTGIGRYLRCLYTELETYPGMEVHYFDGRQILDRIPEPPRQKHLASRWAKVFWRLPSHLALAVRQALYSRHERHFADLRGEYDIYHEAAYFPFASSPCRHTVFTVHDLSLMRHPEWHPRERVLFFNRHFFKRLSAADSFIAVSEFTRDEMCNLLPVHDRPIHVTPLGVDAVRFHLAQADEVTAFRHRHSLPERYFLFLGSGDPRKNAGVIPQALELSDLDVPLVTAGWDGWEARRLGAARLLPLGYVPDQDLPALYSGALALVYPSLYEGYGLPVLEAQACGCPTITSRGSSLPEAGGDASLYINDPNNPAELAMLLQRVAEDEPLRNDMRNKGIARASAHTWANTAELTYRAFSQVCAG